MATTKKLDLLLAIEQIVEKAKDSGLRVPSEVLEAFKKNPVFLNETPKSVFGDFHQ